MKNLYTIFIVLIGLMMSLSSCNVIGDIFRAGMWTGVIVVAVVVVVVILIVRRFRN
jgi:hypothetical protein